jgi:hypothetical protein
LTVVVINNSVEAQTIQFADSTLSQSVEVYETSETNDLALISSGVLPSNITLAPSSVTTFVMSEGG